MPLQLCWLEWWAACLVRRRVRTNLCWCRTGVWQRLKMFGDWQDMVTPPEPTTQNNTYIYTCNCVYIIIISILYIYMLYPRSQAMYIRIYICLLYPRQSRDFQCEKNLVGFHKIRIRCQTSEVYRYIVIRTSPSHRHTVPGMRLHELLGAWDAPGFERIAARLQRWIDDERTHGAFGRCPKLRWNNPGKSQTKPNNGETGSFRSLFSQSYIIFTYYMIYLKGMMNIWIIQYYTYNRNILITSNLRQSNWTNSSPTGLLWAEALTEQTLPVWWVKLGFPSTRPLRHQPCVTACATHVLQMSLEYDPYNVLISFFNLLHRSYPHDMLHIIIIFTSIFSLAAFATSWRQVLAREFEGPLRSVGWVVRRATQHPQGTGVCQHSVHQRSLKSLTLTFCDFDLCSNFARS